MWTRFKSAVGVWRNKSKEGPGWVEPFDHNSLIETKPKNRRLYAGTDDETKWICR